MDYTRRTEDEYDERYHRCDVCGHPVKIGSAPEGGRYEPPFPAISSATVAVRANCAIKLAGSTTALADGTAHPGQSPILVDLTLVAGKLIVFTGYGHFGSASDLDGDTADIKTNTTENYIGGLAAPNYSICGVFLTDDASSAAPSSDLDFTLEATRNYTSLSPAIAQPFFLGEGQYTSSEVDYYRKVTIPATATRLYLGVHLESGWAAMGDSIIRGSINQATSFDHVSKFQCGAQGFGNVILTDRAASQGCPFCGSPAWRSGGKAGDAKKNWR